MLCLALATAVSTSLNLKKVRKLGKGHSVWGL